MSRIGKLPITVPDGVTVTVTENEIVVKGPKGELSQKLAPEVSISQNENRLIVERTGETKRHLSFHGLYRALINNMVEGVSKGYQRELEIQGVGYTAEVKGKILELSLGFSHPILFRSPEEVTIEIPAKNAIKVSGIDKQMVGEVAAKIRSFRPPEPYKGKGIRYKGEHVRRKVGKTSG